MYDKMGILILGIFAEQGAVEQIPQGYIAT